MKKAIICMIAGGVAAIAGAGLFATTLAHGATGYESRFFTAAVDREDGELEIGFWNDDAPDWPGVSTAPSVSIESSAAASSAPQPDDTADLSRPEDPAVLTAADLSALIIDIGAAEVEVRYGNSFDVRSAGVDDLTWNYVQDEKLVRVESAEKLDWFDDDRRKVYITLPQDTVLDTIGANVNVGDLEIKQAKAGEIVATVNMGDLDVEGFEADTLLLEAGMGDVSAENGTAGDLTITVGTGDGDVENVSAGSLTADIGMGSFEAEAPLQNFDVRIDSGEVELELRGDAADYYVQLENALGTIRTPGGETVNGRTAYGAEGAPYLGSVYAGMGKVELKFRNR